MDGVTGVPHTHFSRRRFIGGVGAAAAVGTAATMAGPGVAQAAGRGRARGRAPGFSGKPAPNPIPPVVDGGGPPPFDFIHWLLPGPEGATTPILGLPGFGLDVDPSQITDFRGFNAYAVVSGTAKDMDGNDYDVELDVRVMDGRYIGVDGNEHTNTFAFF